MWWQRLMDWLPDLRVGVFELRDLLSLGMAVLGAYLAYAAIKMGREQTRIGKEQAEIARRQEALDTEQSQIAKRQAEIAETQHKILLEQIKRRSQLNLRRGQSSYGYADDALTVHRFECQLVIENVGTKAADDVYFRIAAPWVGPYRPTIELCGDTKLITSDDDTFIDVDPETQSFTKAVEVEGRCKSPIYPNQWLPVAWVRVEVDRPDNLQYMLEECEYVLHSADSQTSETGIRKLRLDEKTWS